MTLPRAAGVADGRVRKNSLKILECAEPSSST
jgi:hypothetical protein